MYNSTFSIAAGAAFSLWATCFSFAAAQTADTLLDDVANAYGGAAALNSIQQIEFDSAGYSIARYQSRNTFPPYDRLPIRSFAALDYVAGNGVWENISTWPGELNMGSRAIVNGDDSVSLNTMLRTYQEGSWYSFDWMKNSAALWLTPILVKDMLNNRDEVVSTGKIELRNIEYDTLRFRDRHTVYVNPTTRLINAVSSEEGGMWDHTIDEGETVTVLRIYEGFVETDGVWINTFYHQLVDGVATQDRGLYHVAFNKPVEHYFAIPEGFEEANTAGYGGEGWDITVREAGDGIYVTGNGETHILYVEFNDYFIALETGGFPAHGENSYNAMQPYMKGKPLKYIVPLHHHDDHAWAVHFYARIGATVLTTPDKEGFLRKLLNRSWGDHGPVEDPQFEFFDGHHLRLSDSANTYDLYVWPDAPHSENMIIGYHPASQSMFTGDFYLGWGVPDGSGVRQGATFGVRALARWIEKRQQAGDIGDVETYIAVHGRPMTRAEMREMLSIERQVVSLPDNEAWATATWPTRYGLHDDTAQNPRRSKMFMGD